MLCDLIEFMMQHSPLGCITVVLDTKFCKKPTMLTKFVTVVEPYVNKA